MKRLPLIFSIILAVFGCLNALSPVSITTKTTKEQKNLPTSFSLNLTLDSEAVEKSCSFSAKAKIDADGFFYLKTSGIKKFFKNLEYEDFEILFADFDETWWGIDLWSDDTLDELGSDLVNSLRDFFDEVVSLNHFEKNPYEFAYVSEGIPIKISVIFDTETFSAPEEYKDFSDFFVTSFENI